MVCCSQTSFTVSLIAPYLLIVLSVLLLYLKDLYTSLSQLSTVNEAPSSMTRLGDLLDIGQLFKAFGNN